MPGPKISPCGHPGEPACPPQNAIVVNVGDVVEIDGKKHVVEDDDDDDDKQ